MPATTPMSSAQPSQSDPWAWNQWAQTQDPGLYGWKGQHITADNLKQAEPHLRQAGLWKPEYDGAANTAEVLSSGDDGGGGGYTPGIAGNGADLSGLNGYSVGTARSSGYNILDGVYGANGQAIGGSVRSNKNNGSMHMGDYATMAAVLAGGYGMGAGFGAMGVGAGMGAGTGTLGTISAGAGEVGGLEAMGAYSMPEIGAVPSAAGATAGETAGLTAGQVGAMGGGGVGTLGTIAPGAGEVGALGATAAPATTSAMAAATPSIGTVGSAAMDWTSLIGPGLNFLGSAMNSNAASSAANAQTDAAREAAAIQSQQRAPWVAAGTQALGTLQEGLKPGGAYNKTFTMADAQNSDSMKTALKYGKESVENSAAARSGLLNSNAMKQGAQTAEDISSSFQNQAFNQNLATNNQQLNAMQSLANLGQTNVNAVADSASNAALVGGGARAANSVAQGNIWSKALSDGGNQQGTINILKSIFGNTGGSSIIPMSSGVPSSSDYADNNWIGA